MMDVASEDGSETTRDPEPDPSDEVAYEPSRERAEPPPCATELRHEVNGRVLRVLIPCARVRTPFRGLPRSIGMIPNAIPQLNRAPQE